MSTRRDPQSAELAASFEDRLALARGYASKKQWSAAIEEMSTALMLSGGVDGATSELLKWVQANGNDKESRAALRLIAKHDRGYTGLQALRVLDGWAGPATTVRARARRILTRLDLQSRERALLNGQSRPQDRLEILIEKERFDEALETLRAVGPDVPRPVLLNLIRGLSRHERAIDLLPWVDMVPRLTRDPKVAGAFSYALAAERECHAAVRLLSSLSKNRFPSRAFQALLLCADHRNDEDAAAEILSDWLLHRPHDAFPNKRRLLSAATTDPASVVVELNLISGSVEFQPRDYAHLVEALIPNSPRAALQAAVLGATRFPDDPRLKVKVAQLATSLAREEAEKHGRLKEQVFGELSKEMTETIGADALVRNGGASALHKLLLDASHDARGEGLLAIAELCLSTLRVIATRRDHKARETPQLQDPGYQSWASMQPSRERLANLTRSICLVALMSGEAEKRVLAMLAELQALLLEDSGLSRTLCRLALSETESGAELSTDVWATALSCDDSELHTQLEALISPGRGKVMRWSDFGREGRDDVLIKPVHPGRPLEKGIQAFGSIFNGAVPIGIETRPEFITEPTQVTVYDGHLISFDEESVWSLTSAGFVPPRRSAVLLHSGTKAIALKAMSAIEIAKPALIVPGVPACFSQYFHFAGQILPRILARLHQLGGEGSELAIALPDFAAPFVFDMLAICGIARERIILIPSSKTVRFARARVANPSLDDWQCAPEDLSIARQTLVAATPGPASRRLYLSRSLSSVRSRRRTLMNEDELLEVAKEFQFEIVDPGAMTQEQQRQLFSQAKVLCGPVGAGLTNMLYMPDGGSVISLGVSDITVTIYPGLTLGQELDFTWVFGSFDPSFVHSRRFPQLPYSVKPEDFRRALESVCR